MPSKIEPTSRYVGPSLPIDSKESIELFFKLKQKTENLYVGVGDTRKIVRYDFSPQIFQYLRDRKFLQTFHQSDDNELYDYQFAKCCWLTDSILKHGMNNPLSVHYNPRIQKNVVHPGQSRTYVLSLFQPGPTNFLYFNTSGINLPWLKTFNIISQEQLQDINFLHFTITPDHGSLIPQIFFGNYQDSLVEVTKYQKFIRDRLSNIKFRIKSNVPIHPLEYWSTDNHAPIEIFIKDPYTRPITDDVVRACIMSVLGKPYISDTLEVRVTPL